jgi:hypothetical protein
MVKYEYGISNAFALSHVLNSRSNLQGSKLWNKNSYKIVNCIVKILFCISLLTLISSWYIRSTVCIFIFFIIKIFNFYSVQLFNHSCLILNASFASLDFSFGELIGISIRFLNLIKGYLLKMNRDWLI